MLWKYDSHAPSLYALLTVYTKYFGTCSYLDSIDVIDVVETIHVRETWGQGENLQGQGQGQGIVPQGQGKA